jgi:hypothetical protein
MGPRGAHRPEPTGVRFVLANCSERGRESELNEWYDQYAADCTRPGLLVNAIRYESCEPLGEASQPRYAAVYDTVDSDPARVWPETKDHPAKQFHVRSPLLSVVLKSTYRRIDPVMPVGLAPLPLAVAIVLCDCAEPTRAAELDAWVGEHMRRRVADGDVSRATRYELVEGEPSPPRYLEIYESDHPEGPRLDASNRPALATTRFSGLYKRTFAHP